jgi:hypothetical protein
MRQCFDKMLSVFNRLDTRVLVFLILCLTRASFLPDSNEEEYFAVAKQSINPNWIVDGFSVSDVPGTRVLFEAVVGRVLQHASFESVAFWGRVASFALFAFPLARIFQTLALSNVQVLFFLQVLYLPSQSYLAKGWVFKAFETKVFAYLMIFWSVSFLLRARTFAAALFAGVATLFHLLDGGWYALCLFATLFIGGVRPRRLAGHAAAYVLLVSPLFWYICRTYFINNPSIINNVDVTWVYVYFRNPQHTGLFKSWSYFLDVHATGMALSLAALLVNVFLFRRDADERTGTLTRLAVVCLAQQFLFIGVALVDRRGTLLQYYPFRTSVLSTFLTVLLGVLYCQRHGLEWLDAHVPQWIKHIDAAAVRTAASSVLLAIAVVVLVNRTGKNIGHSLTVFFPDEPARQEQELYAFIREHTARESKFFYFGEQDQDLQFIRQTGRDLFSVYKFVPTENRKIYEWYVRVLESRRVAKDLNRLFELRRQYRIDYVVSRTPLADRRLSEAFTSGSLHLYRITIQDGPGPVRSAARVSR